MPGNPCDAFLAVVTPICDGDPAAADALATALEASAHGHAMLLREDEQGAAPAGARPPRPTAPPRRHSR